MILISELNAKNKITAILALAVPNFGVADIRRKKKN